MSRRGYSAAFTKVELVVILALLIILSFVLFSTRSRAPHGAKRIQCVNNLKHIGLATRIFASTHWDLFPAGYYSNHVAASTFDATDYFAFLINELSTSRILHCPADADRQPANSMVYLGHANVSYFVNLSADLTRPQAFLAGDRNVTIKGTPATNRVTILPADQLGWTSDLHNTRGNILMVDGSVQTPPSNLQSTFTNLLLFP